VLFSGNFFRVILLPLFKNAVFFRLNAFCAIFWQSITAIWAESSWAGKEDRQNVDDSHSNWIKDGGKLTGGGEMLAGAPKWALPAVTIEFTWIGIFGLSFSRRRLAAVIH
jgi:hypothetical protein